MKFSCGQEVTLKENCDLTIFDVFPRFGKVYTIAAYPLQGHPHFQDWICFEEFDSRSIFDENLFEALISDDQLMDDLIGLTVEQRILANFLRDISLN